MRKAATALVRDFLLATVKKKTLHALYIGKIVIAYINHIVHIENIDYIVVSNL